MKQDNEPASAGDVDVRALDRAALLALIARVAPDLLPPDRPQRPVTERVSDILDAMPDHWQASWHALLDLLPLCSEGDDLALTDKAAAIAHFSAVRDTIAARLPGLRDDGEDLAGLIVDCDRDIADLSRARTACGLPTLRAIHPPSSATSSSTSEVPPTLDPGRPLQWGDRVVIRPYEEWPCDLGQHARARNSWVSKCRELAGHEGVINSEGESEGCVMVYLRREPYGTVRDIPATIVRRVSP